MFTEVEMKQIVCHTFEENGIDINDQEAIENMDSLEYIATLVSLEEKFKIEFPDAMLTKNMFENMNDFYLLLGWLLGISDLKGHD